MQGSADGTVQGFQDVMFTAWSREIQKNDYAHTKSFEPQKVQNLPAQWRNWKYFWSTCNVKVVVEFRCYAERSSYDAKAGVEIIPSRCVVLAGQPPNDFANWSYWVFLTDKVLTRDVMWSSKNIPPWPSYQGARRDQNGQYYRDISYTFRAIVKKPVH
jgi:hypothetical protein